MGQYEASRNTSQNERDAAAAAWAQGQAQGVTDTMATYVDITINDNYDPDGFKDLINENIEYEDYDWDTFGWRVTTEPEDWDVSDNGVFESEINYAWYAADPLYATVAIDNDIDISDKDGLIEATKIIVETSKVVLGGGFSDLKWRKSAKELSEREPYKPKPLDVSSVYTEPEYTAINKHAEFNVDNPKYGAGLQNLKIRAPSRELEHYRGDRHSMPQS